MYQKTQHCTTMGPTETQISLNPQSLQTHTHTYRLSPEKHIIYYTSTFYIIWCSTCNWIPVKSKTVWYLKLLAHSDVCISKCVVSQKWQTTQKDLFFFYHDTQCWSFMQYNVIYCVSLHYTLSFVNLDRKLST